VKRRFTPHAARDLTQIADHLRARNPAAAPVVRDAIVRSLREQYAKKPVIVMICLNAIKTF